MPAVNTKEWLDPEPRANLLRTEVSETQLLNSLLLCPAETAMDCPRLEPNITAGFWTSHSAFAEETESTVGEEYEMTDVDDTTTIPVVTTKWRLELCPLALLHMMFVVDDQIVAAQAVDPSLIDVLYDPCFHVEPPDKFRTDLLAKFPNACIDVDANENDSVQLPVVRPTVTDTNLDAPTCCST
jgi:hypothetical protein